MAIKTFTTGEVLTASDTNTYLANSGLVYVTSVNVPASPAQSSVAVAGCFTSTYDNYRIIYSGGTASGNAAMSLQLLPTSTTGYNTTYFSALNYLTYAGVAGNARDNNSDKFTYVGTLSTPSVILCVDIYQPFTTRWTSYAGGYMDEGLTGPTSGIHKVASSFTGFTLTGQSQTFNNGTVTVYGYRKA